MAGPSGFVNRSKGKSSFQSLWVSGSQQGGPGSMVAYSTAAGSNGLAIGSLGMELVSAINASSGASVFTLPAPVAGIEKVIAIETVSSGVFIKAGALGGFDASTNTVFKSTYAMQVELVGRSSLAWRIVGVWPPPSTLVGGSGVTLTTTT